MVALEILSWRLQCATVNVDTVLYQCANVITFLQAVLCAAIDSAEEEAEAENEWIE